MVIVLVMCMLVVDQARVELLYKIRDGLVSTQHEESIQEKKDGTVLLSLRKIKSISSLFRPVHLLNFRQRESVNFVFHSFPWHLLVA